VVPRSALMAWTVARRRTRFRSSKRFAARRGRCGRRHEADQFRYGALESIRPDGQELDSLHLIGGKALTGTEGEAVQTQWGYSQRPDSRIDQRVLEQQRSRESVHRTFSQGVEKGPSTALTGAR
jgi:hypothetical protein